jgi:uncharacterized repeat protein (TIGR03803 family)
MLLAAVFLLAAVLAPSNLRAVTLTTLSAFSGANGAQPIAGLVLATNGNFYGTTLKGGASNSGTVFVLSASGTVSNLVSFDGVNAAQPAGMLTLGNDGNLYGTASAGGASNNGVVFLVTPAGALTNLASFAGVNGSAPYGGLIQASDGNFYGTTSQGGDFNLGTVFMVTPGGSLRTLVSFNRANGAQPFGGLVARGTNTTFYGTTSAGGQFNCGTVFMLRISTNAVNTNGPSTNIVFTNLHAFTGAGDGAGPQAGLCFGPDGNLYGTTAGGGTNGYGTIFFLTTGGALTNLASFSRTNGATPSSPLTLAADGNLYGTTAAGGAHGAGTVFSVNTNGTMASVYSFAGGSGGGNPLYAGVVQGTNGNFYGTLSAGGPGENGTVFQLSGFVPEIVSQPADQTVSSGATVTLAVTATGSAPLHFQWQFNSNSLANAGRFSGVNSPILTISNIAAANAGSYRVIVRNTAGSATNSGTLLTVVNALGTNHPTVAITSPHQGASLNTTLVTLRGTAKGTVPVSRVYFQVNNGAWQLASSSSGWATWTASLTLPQGSNVVAAYAVNAVGIFSQTNYVSFTCGLSGVPVTIQISGAGTVSPNYNLVWLQPGADYKMTAKPGAGNLFSNWTEIAGSTPFFSTNAPSLTFTAQSNLVIQASFVANPFLNVSGAYTGLFYDTNEIVPESTGFVTFSLTSQGKFSGSLRTGAARYQVSGQFDLNGNSQTIVKRHAATPLVVGLQLDLTDGGDQITGTVSNGVWQAVLAADRAVFNGRTTNAPQAGQYTIVVPGGNDSAALPGGDGYGTIRVDKTGLAHLTGALADGTKISQASTLSKNGQWPLYVPLYSGQGMFVSWLAISNAPAGAVSGTLHWIKPSLASAKFYAAGFTNEPAALGSLYVPPAGQSNVLAFDLGTLALTDGNLAQTTTNRIAIGAKNKVLNLSGPNLTLTFTPSSGLFRGKVTAAPPKTMSFNGVVLQSQQVGRGYFLGTSQSGQVLIQSE